jgi:hypothetical protein
LQARPLQGNSLVGGNPALKCRSTLLLINR